MYGGEINASSQYSAERRGGRVDHAGKNAAVVLKDSSKKKPGRGRKKMGSREKGPSYAQATAGGTLPAVNAKLQGKRKKTRDS